MKMNNDEEQDIIQSYNNYDLTPIADVIPSMVSGYIKDEKKLISHEELCSLIGEYLLPMISRLGGALFNNSTEPDIGWLLTNTTSGHNRLAGARLHNKDHWCIYNEWYKIENINIEIYNDHIEFIEYSEFKHFSRDEMYSLYEFLKERIFDNKESENKEENKNG
jgi:hypothetical protein